MRNTKLNNGDNLIRWVALLSAMAVVLPTFCLLWLMMQAVKNERLAIKEKFAMICQEYLDDEQKHLTEKYTAYISQYSTSSQSISDFLSSKTENVFMPDQSKALLIYNENGKLIYPKIDSDIDIASDVTDETIFELASRIEFVDKNYIQAAEEYGCIEMKLKNENADITLICRCILAKARCFKKAAQTHKALTVYESLKELLSDSQNNDVLTEYGCAANIEIAVLCKAYDYNNFKLALNDLMDAIVNNTTTLAHKEFLLSRIDAMTNNGKEIVNDLLYDKYRSCILRVLWDKSAAYIAQRYPRIDKQENWKNTKLIRLELPAATYALCYTQDNNIHMLINPPNFLSESQERFRSNGYDLFVMDNQEKYVGISPKEKTGTALVNRELSNMFPGWVAQIHPADGNIFSQSAKKQQLVYIWGSILVIIFMFLCSWLVLSTVGKQIKLNNLKNNFIATVTHELKTPLASMRVLVDTLIEGNIKDSNTAHEYLGLIAKENHRLTRLIDNFLTFSRMERKKTAFNITSCDPADIINDAATAIQTHLSNNNCSLYIDLEDDLPQIEADHDAIVTVLINLIDNACKYSTDIKEVYISAGSDGNMAYLCVEDKGKGISRKQLKRIFDKFYQADSTLSRTVEGCGLGLSIVKYIVDAHSGTIDVRSQIGKGSKFRVKLPKA